MKRTVTLGEPMKEPATEKQIKQLRRLEIPFAEGVSKYQATKLLQGRFIVDTIRPRRLIISNKPFKGGLR